MASCGARSRPGGNPARSVQPASRRHFATGLLAIVQLPDHPEGAVQATAENLFQMKATAPSSRRRQIRWLTTQVPASPPKAMAMLARLSDLSAVRVSNPLMLAYTQKKLSLT